jgi:tRNA G26 N,N-dimethylase Trm1
MIQINKEALNRRIEISVENAIQSIKENAVKGFNITSIEFPSDIYHECKDQLNKFMENEGNKYVWVGIDGYGSVRNGNNMLTRFKLL